MDIIDCEHDENLKKMRKLHREIGRLLDYDNDEDLPGDVDHPTSQRQVGAYCGWSGQLDEKAGEFMGLVDAVQIGQAVQDNFDEQENEKLPDDGIRTGYLVGQ